MASLSPPLLCTAPSPLSANLPSYLFLIPSLTITPLLHLCLFPSHYSFSLSSHLLFLSLSLFFSTFLLPHTGTFSLPTPSFFLAYLSSPITLSLSCSPAQSLGSCPLLDCPWLTGPLCSRSAWGASHDLLSLAPALTQALSQLSCQEASKLSTQHFGCGPHQSVVPQQ